MTGQVQARAGLSVARARDGSVYYVRICGDVDLGSSRAVGLLARELITADADAIYVDLADVTAMGSTLVGFLVQIANAKRPTSPLVLCRPTSPARRAIEVAGLGQLADLHTDLPFAWPADDDRRPAASGEINARES
jgi:anti-anti-sigma factor